MEKRRQRAESVKPYTNLERDSQRAKKWQRLWHLWRSLASVLFIVLLAFLWGSAWLLIGYCAFSLATYHLLLYGHPFVTCGLILLSLGGGLFLAHAIAEWFEDVTVPWLDNSSGLLSFAFWLLPVLCLFVFPTVFMFKPYPVLMSERSFGVHDMNISTHAKIAFSNPGREDLIICVGHDGDCDLSGMGIPPELADQGLNIKPGQTIPVEFATAGDYQIINPYVPGMVMIVHVQENDNTDTGN
ncbi:MAG TPA: hypothetical protein VKX46_15945 [Ktedonobacteraceae bacterium]|nr:hypothetical protein [Ktedonobacteraceae bacterium]